MLYGVQLLLIHIRIYARAMTAPQGPQGPATHTSINTAIQYLPSLQNANHNYYSPKALPKY